MRPTGMYAQCGSVDAIRHRVASKSESKARLPYFRNEEAASLTAPTKEHAHYLSHRLPFCILYACSNEYADTTRGRSPEAPLDHEAYTITLSQLRLRRSTPRSMNEPYGKHYVLGSSVQAEQYLR
jgi:hypothetical protein